MDLNIRKEEFGHAYVHAVAAAAGYSMMRTLVDDDSIDLQLVSKRESEYVRSPRLEIQLKSTSQDLFNNGYLHFPLKLKNYNDLRSVKLLVPRLLVCIVLPADDPDSWLLHSEEKLIMMKCGYWMDLKGYPPQDNTSSITVRIPQTQLLNTIALTNLMEGIRKE